MSIQSEISQRDLRLRSKEIMDSVEAGQAFTVTRDGRQIGRLTPLRNRRTFVRRDEIIAAFGGAPPVELARFRADQDRYVDNDLRDPYDR